MWTQRRRTVLLTLVAAMAVWLMGSPVLGATQDVKIAGFAFAPASLTVTVGDTVTWKNGDSVGHTATAGDGSFDTGTIAGGASASVTFSKAGTFAYACKIHPAMTGTIVVQAASGGSGSGGTASPPATDTVVPTTPESRGDPSLVIAALLAVLGVAMVLGTIAFERRAARATTRRD